MESEQERSERTVFTQNRPFSGSKGGNSLQLEGGLMIADGATHFVLSKVRTREPPSGQKSCSQNLTLSISDDQNFSQKTRLLQFLMMNICVKTIQSLFQMRYDRVWSSCLDTHLRHRESEESSCSQKWLHVVLGHLEPPGGGAGDNFTPQRALPALS